MDVNMTHQWESDTPDSKQASLDLTKTHDTAAIIPLLATRTETKKLCYCPKVFTPREFLFCHEINTSFCVFYWDVVIDHQ